MFCTLKIGEPCEKQRETAACFGVISTIYDVIRLCRWQQRMSKRVWDSKFFSRIEPDTRRAKMREGRGRENMGLGGRGRGVEMGTVNDEQGGVSEFTD